MFLNEGMVQGFLQGHSLFRVSDQEFGDEASDFGTLVLLEVKVHVQDLLLEDPIVFAFERSASGAQFVTQDPQTPVVHLSVVILMGDDFRGEVLLRPTVSPSVVS